MKKTDFNDEIVFNFEGSDIQSYFNAELRIGRRLKKSFDYVVNKLGVQKLKESLEKLKWHETKNYDWCAVGNETTTFLIRKYRSHFTIYSKHKHKDDEFDFFQRNFDIFTYQSNTEMLSAEEHDERVDNPCMDLDQSINQLFEIAGKNELHTIWNTYSFIRPKHVEVKVVINGESISSYDLLIFACEEISTFGQQLFAENDVLEKIKTLKIGADFSSRFGDYTIVDIRTEFPKQYSDPYYHGVGLTLKNKRDSKEEFQDVYSLTHWHIEGLKF